MPRLKSCLHCGQPFFGRRDAKTCSVRCRKGLQRARDFLVAEANRTPSTKFADNTNTQGVGTSVVARPASAHRARRRGGLRHLLILLVFMSLLTVVSLPGRALAVVSQGFVTDDKNLRQYMAVSLTGDNSEGKPVVQSASINRAANAIGVAVGLNDSLLAIAPQSSQVYVVSSGPTKAYVSDINGLPKKGDLLAVSPLRGILMKVPANYALSVGNALGNFDVSTSQSVKALDENQQPMTTHVEIMSVNLAINSPQPISADSNSNWLSKTATGLTGQKVSGLRVLSALAIFFTLMVVEGEIIYSTVTSSMTALGRNPLARKSIIKQSVHSAGIAGIILTAGIGVIAMLIWV